MKLVCFLIINFMVFSVHLSAGWWDRLFFCCFDDANDDSLSDSSASCSLMAGEEAEEIEPTWQEIIKNLGPDVINCALIPLGVVTHPSPRLLEEIKNLKAQQANSNF